MTGIMRRVREGKTKGNKERKQEVTKKRQKHRSPFLKRLHPLLLLVGLLLRVLSRPFLNCWWAEDRLLMIEIVGGVEQV